jgi:hypothetical protein
MTKRMASCLPTMVRAKFCVKASIFSLMQYLGGNVEGIMKYKKGF